MLVQVLVWLQQVLATALLLVSAESRQTQLFRSWEKAKADTRSLVVEFTLERTDRSRQEKARYEGTVKLLRTPKGEVLASYTLTKAEKPGAPGKPLWVGLLNGGIPYLLDTDENSAMRFAPTGGDVRLWLEEKFNPFALLLDEKHARANNHLKVVKLDRWYTYLEITPRKPTALWWGWGTHFARGRAVFMNKDGEGVPKDMPRQLWYEDRSGASYLFEIRSWKANAADGPKAEEFTRPEDRPGWEVNEWRGFLLGAADKDAIGTKPAPLVGLICINGNNVTYDSAFLDRLGLHAGSPFTEADLRAAERRLIPLSLLGIRCSVTALDREGDGEYKDILVTARESPMTRIAGPLYNAVSQRVGLISERVGMLWETQRPSRCRPSN